MQVFSYICRIMRRFLKTIGLSLTVLAAVSCAKTVTETGIASEERAFDSWMHVHYPGIAKSGNGIYILEDIPGDGDEAEYDNYIFFNYESRSLYDGTISDYNEGSTALQLGTWDKSYYYGPSILHYSKDGISCVLHEMIRTEGTKGAMRMGGKRTAIVPAWINGSYGDFNSEEEYKANGINGSACIYTIELVRMTSDLVQDQIDSVEYYLKNVKGLKELPDTTGKKGFYFTRNTAREKLRGVKAEHDVVIPADSVVYIEYVGRLLNGKVFDTNIKDTAIKYGLGSRTSSYTPASITWASDSLSIKMGENSVVSGFSLALWNMHPFESGDAVFISNWGYGVNGSNKVIPSHAPLVFEIDIVDKPE